MTPPRAGDTVSFGNIKLHFLVDPTQGSGNVVMAAYDYPPGSNSAAPHCHQGVEELVYGLEGVLSVTIGDETRELCAGEAVLIPTGTVHTHRNRGSELARALIVSIGPTDLSAPPPIAD